MKDFPEFLKNPANKVASASQYTQGIEGWVFDGADGAQVAFWNCFEAGQSQFHAHDFDEYILVVEGCYTLIFDGQRISLNPGDEYVIKKGVYHGGESAAGTRCINVFGGKRAKRTAEA